MPRPPHSRTTRRLIRRLAALFPEPDWAVGIQDSITLADSEPEPDFFAATGPAKKYDNRHPGPEDLVLVVEVSAWSAAFDRKTKVALYTGSKIPQYWIIDVNARRIEVYPDPRGGKNSTYRKRAEFAPGVTVGRKRLGTLASTDLLP